MDEGFWDGVWMQMLLGMIGTSRWLASVALPFYVAWQLK